MRTAALIRRSVGATILIALAVQIGGTAAQGTPSGSHLRKGPLTMVCPVTRWVPPGGGTGGPPLATGTGGQLQVRVPPLVLVTVDHRVLWVSTNTGRPPARTDEFYLIRHGRASLAPEPVIEKVLRVCH